MFTAGFRDTTDAKKKRGNGQASKKQKTQKLSAKEEMQSRYDQAVSKQIKTLLSMKDAHFHPDRSTEHCEHHVNEATNNINKYGVKSWAEFVAYASGYSMCNGVTVFRHSQLDENYPDEVQVTIVTKVGEKCKCGKIHQIT